ncbi:MAG TPA: hypothetical protein VIY26_04085, partial [Acidimicrobiales bacterium]
ALLGGGAALAVWCGWVSGFHRSTTAAEVTWVVSLAFVVAVAVACWLGRRGSRVGWPLGVAADPWPRRGRGGGRRALLGVAPWLVVIVVAAAWDLLGIDTGTHEAHLTISALSEVYRPLNALLLLVWMLVGIGYAAARARAPLVRADVASGEGGVAVDRTERGAAWGALAAPAGGHSVTPALLLPSNRPVGVVFWVAVLLATVAVDVAARRSAGRMATAEEFARFISTAWPANVALIAAWAFAGYHLFAR